jgi:hypothetical protein
MPPMRGFQSLREIEQRVAYAEALTIGKAIFEWSGGRAKP